MSTATARSTAPRKAPQRATPTRPALDVVDRRSRRRRRLPELLAVLALMVSLMMVVVGHDLLAQGQLRMGALNAALVEEQAVHSATVLKVAALETPSRISAEASSLQLTQPSLVLQLPTVSLVTPLAPIKITPAPRAK